MVISHSYVSLPEGMFLFHPYFFHSLMRKNHRFFWLYLPQFPAGAFRRRIHLRPHRFRTTTARQLGEHVGKMLENMLNWNQHKSASFLQLVAIIDNVLTKAGTIVGLDERRVAHVCWCSWAILVLIKIFFLKRMGFPICNQRPSPDKLQISYTDLSNFDVDKQTHSKVVPLGRKLVYNSKYIYICMYSLWYLFMGGPTL
jgi:hypothetical protein